MKAAFSAEAIGRGQVWELTPIRDDPHGLMWLDRPAMPWVAEVTGLSERYGLAREFLRPRYDYREANRTAARGVRAWWTLEEGRVYQARYRVTRDKWVTRWLTVTPAGEIAQITGDQARERAAEMDGARAADGA